MNIEQALRGSYTTEKSKAYKEALRKFKKNRLLRWRKKKKKKLKLKEEWANSVKSPWTFKKKLFDIFVNPTSKELKELKKYQIGVRFIVDNKNKKMYVFSSDLLHNSAAAKLNLDYTRFSTKRTDLYFGEGSISGNKILVDNWEKKNLRKYGDWIDKYIET